MPSLPRNRRLWKNINDEGPPLGPGVPLIQRAGVTLFGGTGFVVGWDANCTLVAFTVGTTMMDIGGFLVWTPVVVFAPSTPGKMNIFVAYTTSAGSSTMFTGSGSNPAVVVQVAIPNLFVNGFPTSNSNDALAGTVLVNAPGTGILLGAVYGVDPTTDLITPPGGWTVPMDRGAPFYAPAPNEYVHAGSIVNCAYLIGTDSVTTWSASTGSGGVSGVGAAVAVCD